MDDWETEASMRKTPRRVSLHSVGVSGVNAHVVLEENPFEKLLTPVQTDDFRIVVVSAKSKRSLKDSGLKWLNYLESVQTNKENTSLSLANIAYSSQVSREAMRYRQAFVVKDIESLIVCFRKAIGGSKSWQGDSSCLITGSHELSFESKKYVQEFVHDRSFDYLIRIANQWTAGQSIDWERFSGDEKLNRVVIPDYCFENKKYWCDEASEDLFEKFFYETFDA